MLNFHARRLSLSFLTGVLSAGAAAQSAWPERPIQMIVPFRAGGGVDVIARPFAEMFGALLQQPVVVMPRDGAAGTIGMGVVVTARPDGYILAFTPNGPVTVQPHAVPTLAHKMDSLQPLCQIFAVQYVLAVRPDGPHKTLGELIAAAKAQPASCRTASAA